MKNLTLKKLAIPMIKSIDSFNYLLKSHHKRVAIISYHLGLALQLNEDELLKLVIAASLHDIGALSVSERDLLIQEDVENPNPHCIMGYKMLSGFEVFKDIAQIIKHHHIALDDCKDIKKGEVPFQSFIIHLADRVDILLLKDMAGLEKREYVVSHMEKKVGTIFHPDVYNVFLQVSKSEAFWNDIETMNIDQLFRKMDFVIDYAMDYDDILEFALVISKIVDFRSRFTASHSYTVAQLASLLGKLLGHDTIYCKKLKIAGYLHDIGKIGIDPAIIEKDGPLNAQEFKEIQLHPYYSQQILHELQKTPWFLDIVSWAAKHHEKNDGKGYPYHLHEDTLDEGTKILAFADVITALMENRPYREGMDIKKAFNIIKNDLAPKISSSMFEKIELYEKEIDSLVQECNTYSSLEYKNAINEANS